MVASPDPLSEFDHIRNNLREFAPSVKADRLGLRTWRSNWRSVRLGRYPKISSSMVLAIARNPWPITKSTVSKYPWTVDVVGGITCLPSASESPSSTMKSICTPTSKSICTPTTVCPASETDRPDSSVFTINADRTPPMDLCRRSIDITSAAKSAAAKLPRAPLIERHINDA